MGAKAVYKKFPGNYTKKQINSWFKQQKAKDQRAHGIMHDKNPYKGDWQTIDHIHFHPEPLFYGFDEALEYALDNAEKWVYAIAVRYEERDPQILEKGLAEIRMKLEKERARLKAVFMEGNHEIQQFSTENSHLQCKNCHSKLSTQFLKTGVYYRHCDFNSTLFTFLGSTDIYLCPLCKKFLYSEERTTQIHETGKEIRQIDKEISEEKRILESNNQGEIMWLLAGLAAE